jgi:hypothetical protein
MTPAILQRVVSASVTVDKQLVSSIGQGILVLAAVGPDDTKKDAESMAAKVLKLKLWPDEGGNGVCVNPRFALQPLLIIRKWKRSVQDIEGEVLCGKGPALQVQPVRFLINRQSPSLHYLPLPRKATSRTSMALPKATMPRSFMTTSTLKCRSCTSNKESRTGCTKQ